MNSNYQNIDIKSLLIIIQRLKNTSGDIEHLENICTKFINYFRDNFDFLVSINIARIENDKCYLVQNLDIEQEEEILIGIIESVLRSNCSYRDELFEYIDNFTYLEGNYVFKPKITERIKYSCVRDFLISLEFLFFDDNKQCYFLSDKYYASYFLARQTISQSALDVGLAALKDIGDKAEKEILKYEEDRLSIYEHDLIVKHIAPINARAGFDIESHTYDKNNDSFIPRYIEVKAYSVIKKRFYWTINEVNTAKQLSDKYYLYLLPLTTIGKFNLDGLTIIKNPAEIIFNSDNWNVEVECFKVFIPD